VIAPSCSGGRWLRLPSSTRASSVHRARAPAQAHEGASTPGRYPADVLEDAPIQRVLSEALARGGDFAELFVERRRSVSLRLEERRVENVSSGRDAGAGVRVVEGERASYAYTNVLREDALLDAARAARAGLSAPARTVADLTHRRRPIRHPVAVPPDEVAPARKVASLWAADEAARSVGTEVRQVTASYLDVHQEVLVATSEGAHARDDRTRVRFAVQVAATRNAQIATGFEAPGHSGGFELLDASDPAELGAAAARTAVKMLEARPSPAGQYPVVLAPGTGGVLIHEACGHGLEADTLVKQASVYAGREGERFGSRAVTIVDDATDTGAWGSFGIDDEGTPAQRTVLFDEGVLLGHLSDVRSARKIGHPSTGNGRRESYAHLPLVRMSNTYLLPGNDDPGDIVRSVERGVYAATFAGGEVNPATGNFVFGMSEAYMIDNGEIAYPLKGATLIGNGPEVLGVIEAVGSDFGRKEGVCGKDGQQAPVTNGMATVLLGKMTVGGTDAQ
jgi:TldD protein